MNHQELANLFTYHAPNPKQVVDYQAIRDRAKVFAGYINRACPDSREKSLAITAIQEAVMWANASIALHTSTDFHPPPLDHKEKNESK